MSDETDERAELEEYRRKVVEEVVRRGELLKRSEADVAAAEHMIQSADNQTAVPLGNTVKLQQREAYKATLKRKRELLDEKRRVARQDLMKAEQRLAEVDARIHEISKAGLGVLDRGLEDDASE
jgi:hypothetical protein